MIYNFLFALSLVLGFSLFARELLRLDSTLSLQRIGSIFIRLLLSGLIGATIISHMVYGLPSGLSVLGSIYGAFFFLFFFSKPLSYIETLNASARAFAPALCLGKWGCYFAGCCTGARCPVLPLQLAESLGLLLLCVLIYARPFFLKKLRFAQPATIGLVGYGLLRFAAEFYRDEAIPLFRHFSAGHAMAIGLIFLGVFLDFLATKDHNAKS